MYLDAQSSLKLYKINLQFCFRLCDLLRESGVHWSEAGNRAVDGCAAELESATTRMLDAGDWNALGFVAGDLFWKALQLQTGAVQQLAETVLGNQTAVASGVQAAVSEWQRESAAALKESTGAMPISTSLQDYMQDYLHLLVPSAPAPRKAGRRVH